MDKETLDILVDTILVSSVVGSLAWLWYSARTEDHLHLGKDSGYTRSFYYIKNLFSKGKFRLDYNGFRDYLKINKGF